MTSLDSNYPYNSCGFIKKSVVIMLLRKTITFIFAGKIITSQAVPSENERMAEIAMGTQHTV